MLTAMEGNEGSGGVGSNHSKDILDEAERLLAKMSSMTTPTPSSGGGDEGQGDCTAGGVKTSNGDKLHFENAHDNGHSNTLMKLTAADGEAKDENAELNEMLLKAEHLSCMMQSISENFSVLGSSSVGQMSASWSKRDPDGNSIIYLRHEQKMEKNCHNATKDASSPVGLAPTSTDDVSSGRRSLRQDPPGSVGGEQHAEVMVTNHHQNNNNTEQNNAQSYRDQKPTSSVHLHPSMMDDDVSSVGSASFRPYGVTKGGGYSSAPYINSSFSHFPPSLTHKQNPNELKHSCAKSNITNNDLAPSQPGDFLLGIPRMRDHSNLDAELSRPVDEDNGNVAVPVSFNLPPTDLRANFDLVDTSSSRRDASEGAVQWERVTTALPGEDDYVPMADYSNIRPYSKAFGNSLTTAGSRLEQLRRRNMAHRNRRRRALTAVSVCVAVVAVAYAKSYRNGNAVLFVEVQEDQGDVPIGGLKTYDTTLLCPGMAAISGYCFEGASEDSSLVVTFPKVLAPEKEPEATEEQITKGWFGRMRRMKR